MSSPLTVPPLDLSRYIDLRVYDRSNQDILDAALALLRLNIPGYAPREGDTEVLLLESLGVEIDELIAAVNRLPGAVLETLLLLANVDRDFGSPAIAAVEVFVADTLGRTIPGGTRVMVPTEQPGRSVIFLVEPPGIIIPTGSYSATGSIISDTFTAESNGMPIGTACQLADNVSWVDKVTLTMQVADGRGVEPDTEWRDRGVARLARLSDVLATPRQFELAATERVEVQRAVALDLYDPASPLPIGSNPGHVTVGVLGGNGAPLSALVKAQIEDDLELHARADLDVHVYDATVTKANIAVAVKLDGTRVLADVTEGIRQTLNYYLDPLLWLSSERKVRINEIVSLSDQVSGVSYIVRNGVTINTVNDDWTIPGVGGLPDLGTITVTTGV